MFHKRRSFLAHECRPVPAQRLLLSQSCATHHDICSNQRSKNMPNTERKEIVGASALSGKAFRHLAGISKAEIICQME